MASLLARSSRVAPFLASLLLACGGGDEGSSEPGGPGGSAQAGKGGSGAGASGAAGAQSGAGNAGAAGAAGSGGAGATGGAGTGGDGGQGGGGGAGVSGSSGQGGDGGSGGAAGSGGNGGGGGGAAGSGGSAAGSGGSSSGAGGGAGDAGAGGSGGSSACPTGELCEGGICAGGVCCKASLACGESCCGDGELCSFGSCVAPGKACFDSSDCGESEYCERGGSEPSGGGAGGQCSGGSGAEGVCLPLPPICAEGESGVGPGGQITCLQKCEVKPDFVDFTPELKYAWGGQVISPTSSDVMMTPIVIQLDDDDCDGKVTERDIPEIVFTTFASGAYTQAGTLRAISIVNGEIVEKWSVPAAFHAGKHLAGGDLDGLPGSEIVGCTTGGTARAYRSDGTLLWTSTLTGCGQPAIADMDGDGKPEVIIEGGILDGATGATKATFSPAMFGTFVVSDLDSDGQLDVVSASQAYHADGTQFVNVPAPNHPFSGCANSYYFCAGPALADLDKDGKPEVIAVHYQQHALAIWQYDPAQPGNHKIVRSSIDINKDLNPNLCPSGSAGNIRGGGPATVGDFNADSFPDVALAGGVGYAVLDGKKLMDPAVSNADTFLWVKQTQDCSSAGTGSSLFDFNGDGKAEVLYADETQFRIYEGATGNVLFSTCNTSGTLSEYPVVADVDNDGQADIIVASNAYSGLNCGGGAKTSGIRVFSSKSGGWVRTRRVWNQHAYSISNINEDGSVPAKEVSNWKHPGLNNFRINKQPGLEFAAPDVVIEVRPDCAKGNVIAMIVRNLGQSVLPPGVVVDLFKGTPPGGQLINEQFTTQALFPAQSEILYALVDDPDVLQGLVKVYGMVSFTSTVEECRKDNNTSQPVFGACAKF